MEAAVSYLAKILLVAATAAPSGAFGSVLIYLAAILALGSLGQWLAWRFRFPAILLLLAFGYLAGHFDSPTRWIPPDLLFPVVSLAVAVILFEGGLSLRLQELDEAGGVIVRLVTIGALITWGLSGLAAWKLFDIDRNVAILIGAILTVTGPTVIGPLLQHIRPQRRVASIAKWEGIVIDPIGATLAVVVFEVINGSSTVDAGVRLLKTFVGGGVIGLAAGGFVLWFLLRRWIPDFLQNSILLTAVIGAFVISNEFASESGLVAVTVFGVVLANQKWVTITHLVEFKEHLRTLLIATLFILLASLVPPRQILELGLPGGLFLLALLATRVVAIFGATVGSGLSRNEKLFLSCLAPRGIVAAAVATLFALELAEAGLIQEPERDRIVAIVFLVITGTVVIYGFTAGPVARALKLADPDPKGILFLGGERFVRMIAAAVQDEGFQVRLVDTNHRNVALARMEGIKCYNASILSEYVRDNLDLGGIGRLLAMTGSTEVNTLAALEYAHVFGRDEVYQLRAATATDKRKDRVAPHMRARMLFNETITYGDLAAREAHGAVIKKTKLSDEFTYADFRALYGDHAVVLFLLDDDKLTICTADEPLEPAAGCTLISLVEPIDEPQVDAAADNPEASEKS